MKKHYYLNGEAIKQKDLSAYIGKAALHEITSLARGKFYMYGLDTSHYVLGSYGTVTIKMEP